MLLVFLLLGSLSVPLAGQTQTAPSTPRPAPRPAARATATAPTALNIQVTDTMGAPLANTRVTLQGPVSREGTTEENGALRLTNMRAGTYRVRLVRDGSITLERDLVMRAGESLTVDIALSAAPLPPKLPEPVKPVAPEPVVKMLPPPVDPKITPVPLFLEKNFIGREGRKDSLLGCTPTSTATLHQLREAWLGHSHEDADEWIYVVAGEGTLRIGTSDQRVQAGTFSLVPHTLAHAILPQGRNPLIVISVLSGPPCKQ
jgi:mannose-6-phosphate isomerase-like protein (cupin superfamily)